MKAIGPSTVGSECLNRHILRKSFITRKCKTSIQYFPDTFTYFSGFLPTETTVEPRGQETGSMTGNPERKILLSTFE